MSVRIRYSKPVEGVLTSTQFYVHENGTRYQVQIRVDSNKVKTFPWKVTEDITDKVTGEGIAVNLHQAKIKAKQKLSELGILFEGESRQDKELPVVQA